MIGRNAEILSPAGSAAAAVCSPIATTTGGVRVPERPRPRLAPPSRWRTARRRRRARRAAVRPIGMSRHGAVRADRHDVPARARPSPSTSVGSASTACTTTTLPGPVGKTSSRPRALWVVGDEVAARQDRRRSPQPTAAIAASATRASSSGATRRAPLGEVTTIQSMSARSSAASSSMPAGSSTISISGTTTPERHRTRRRARRVASA